MRGGLCNGWWLGVLAFTIGCTPGELDEARQEYLRKELAERYPETERPAPRPDGGTQQPDTDTDTQPDTDTEPGEIPACALQVFSTTCAGSACHHGGTFRFPPDLQEGDVFTTLTTGTTTCRGVASTRYVDLDDPQASYLLVKVRGQQPSTCGTPMPPETDTLSADDLSCLEDWIGSL